MKKLTIVIVIGLLFLNPAFAQEAAKNRIAVFKDFSGGLATKLSDQSTNTKYARIAENVRLNTSFRAIEKRGQIYLYGTSDTTEATTGGYRLYLKEGSKKLIVTHGDEIEVGADTTGVFTKILDLTYANYRWEWITWHDLAIGGDGYNNVVKTDGTSATYLGTCFAVDNGAGAGPNGTYTYKVSCHTSSYAMIFDVVSNSVTVVDNDIDLSMIPIGPTTFLGESVLNRCIYRNTVAAPTTWQLLTNGRVNDNTTTILTDSDADGVLGANYPTGSGTWTPPKGKHCLVHKNRLWVANNPTNPSRIYYSENGSHDLFQPTSYFDIRTNDGDEITFIKNLLGDLTVGKTNTIQELNTTGDDPDEDWSVFDPFSFIGCDAPHSAVNTPLGIFYISRSESGIYVYNGQNSVLKSELFTSIIEDIAPSNLEQVWGEFNNNMYYVAYTSSTLGGSKNNRLAVYDMLSNSCVVDTLSFNFLTSFSGSSDGGGLYAGSSLDGKVYSFFIPSQSITHNKSSDFTGTWTHSRYKPVVAGGEPNSPILELAWSDTINDEVGSLNSNPGDVDRGGSGTYVSPILNTPGATSYDKIYWNETLVSGTDATLALRSGSSHTVCEAAAWSSEYSTPSGSDISGVTAGDFTQYRISLTTTDIDKTPNVYTLGGFTVKLAYNKLGVSAETAIALHWQTGYLDFDLPGYKKTLRKILSYHEGTSGTLTIAFTNEHGNTDSFSINLDTNPTFYEEYFTSGAFIGTKFRMDLTNSDLNSIEIKEIVLIYDVEPIY